ncbi:hypothetical protein P872_25530 [Rhodonellum psychrophilum GCM71 = DSM 17998]|uniref:Uncharacterized protein n=1 Tax=Rhodonellum psychrophilum GCM71 = DSM 17998 TaxID=1123057 RepID=U5C6E3_9BACT|nr:hypothetical protein P872_25530 [Rhodonellum psychrophilum GCM71 = DSM 17998]
MTEYPEFWVFRKQPVLVNSNSGGWDDGISGFFKFIYWQI